MALVEEVFDPLAWPEREMMLLAKGAHGVDGLTPAFLFFRAQNRLTGDGFESTFHNFFGRAADAAGERGFEKFLAVGRKIDLHEKDDTTLLPSDNRHYRTTIALRIRRFLLGLNLAKAEFSAEQDRSLAWRRSAPCSESPECAARDRRRNGQRVRP